MKLTFRYPVYPTKTQETTLLKWLDHLCALQNSARHDSCGTSLDRDHNAAINILLRAAAALRGERWVATLYEARNKNEARDKGLQRATQLTLFDATASPSL